MSGIRFFEDTAPRLAAGVFVADSARVIGDVEIGDGSSIWYGTIVRGDVYPIRIGARTNIQDRSVIHVSGGRFSTEVGDDVTVGHGVILHGCTIANRVLVGMAAVVLDDVHVGEGSLVAAGSLLPPGKRYPGGVLILGSPAKVVREITDDERARIDRSAAHYVELGRRHAVGTGPTS